MPQDLIRVDIASKRFGLSQVNLRKWVREDKVAGIKGKPCLVDQTALLLYLARKANPKMRELFCAQYPDLAPRIKNQGEAE